MPQLRQLSCSLQWPETGAPFQEYGTAYGDGVVESFIVVPDRPQAFTIHIRSRGFISEGLAVVVFVDGNYQTNRNRVNLHPPTKDSPSNRSEIDFLIRQKEKPLGDGMYMGREWRFDNHNIEIPPGVKDNHFDHLGTIEVLVLRCRTNIPDEAMASPSSSGADSDVLCEKRFTSEPVTQASPSDSNDSTKENKESTEVEEWQDDLPMFGLFGQFDGGDDRPYPSNVNGGNGAPAGWQWQHQWPHQPHIQPVSGQLPTSQNQHARSIPPTGFYRPAGSAYPPTQPNARPQRHVHFDYGPAGPPPSPNEARPNPTGSRSSSYDRHRQAPHSQTQNGTVPVYQQPAGQGEARDESRYRDDCPIPVQQQEYGRPAAQFHAGDGSAHQAATFYNQAPVPGSHPNPHHYYVPQPHPLQWQPQHAIYPPYTPNWGTNYIPRYGMYPPVWSNNFRSESNASIQHQNAIINPDSSLNVPTTGDFNQQQSVQGVKQQNEGQNNGWGEQNSQANNNNNNANTNAGWNDANGTIHNGNSNDNGWNSTDPNSGGNNGNTNNESKDQWGNTNNSSGPGWGNATNNNTDQTGNTNNNTNNNTNADNWANTNNSSGTGWVDTPNDNGDQWGNNDNSGTANQNPSWEDNNNLDATQNNQTTDDWTNNKNDNNSNTKGWGDNSNGNNQDNGNRDKGNPDDVNVHGSIPPDIRPLFGPHGQYYAWKARGPDMPTPDAEEEPRYDVPRSFAEAKGTTKQVQPGEGYLYFKKRCVPEYIDELSEPYARFVFKYRTKDQLKREIGIDVETEPTGDIAVQELQNMDKQTLIEMLLRAKSALGGKVPSPPMKPTDSLAETGDDRIVPTPVEARPLEFLNYQIPPSRMTYSTLNAAAGNTVVNNNTESEKSNNNQGNTGWGSNDNNNNASQQNNNWGNDNNDWNNGANQQTNNIGWDGSQENANGANRQSHVLRQTAGRLDHFQQAQPANFASSAIDPSMMPGAFESACDDKDDTNPFPQVGTAASSPVMENSGWQPASEPAPQLNSLQSSMPFAGPVTETKHDW